MNRTCTNGRRGLRIAVLLALVAAGCLSENEASAAINAGAEAGVATRSTTPSLGPGLALGVHAEASLIPLLRLGVYYLHYTLPPDLGDDHAHFNAFGLRLRAMVPIPKTDFIPYAQAGLGLTLVRYPSLALPAGVPGGPDVDGFFFEAPLGLGIAYEVASLIQFSAEFDFRPGFGFLGSAYDTGAISDSPITGFTVLGGVSIEL